MKLAIHPYGQRIEDAIFGVTNDLESRLFQHKTKQIVGFTKKYYLPLSVYIEVCGDIREAIARRKQSKGWLRAGKVKLIESVNPDWKDLAQNG